MLGGMQGTLQPPGRRATLGANEEPDDGVNR
jgi:hypothetical protein